MNVNSPLPKLDEIQFIAKHSNALIIGISEFKLDSSIFDSEVDIVGYDIIRMNRSRWEVGSHVILKNRYLIIISNVFVRHFSVIKAIFGRHVILAT